MMIGARTVDNGKSTPPPHRLLIDLLLLTKVSVPRVYRGTRLAALNTTTALIARVRRFAFSNLMICFSLFPQPTIF